MPESGVSASPVRGAVGTALADGEGAPILIEARAPDLPLRAIRRPLNTGSRH
jgi:hypothetical protein